MLILFEGLRAEDVKSTEVHFQLIGGKNELYFSVVDSFTVTF